jgi:hypothetical protein
MAAVNLNGISKEQEAAFRKAFSDSIAKLKNDAVIKDLIDRIAVGDIDGVLTAIGISEASFGSIEQAIQNAYRKGGETAASQVGRIPAPGSDVSFTFAFNVRNPRAEQWLRKNSSSLIVEITEGQREMVRQQLTARLSEGINPRQSALDLVGRKNRVTGRREGGFIGLTEQQSRWVSDARLELDFVHLTKGTDYLSRKLRNKRFDAMVKRANKSGKPLTAVQIQRAITALQSRTLKYRGDVIARTESIDALRAGHHEALRQATEAGEVADDDVTREWDATGDARTRETHVAADGQKRQGDVPFDVGGYQMRYPGDSSLGAPAEERVQCRCIETTSIDFGARVARIEGFG